MAYLSACEACISITTWCGFVLREMLNPEIYFSAAICNYRTKIHGVTHYIFVQGWIKVVHISLQVIIMYIKFVIAC